ncbi:nudix hydrolase 10-like isoform X1 [Tripterygium wilfordii]|uniref:Nudix hydrolase 10-like isoform X1 n=1 Tax=Tripterygium wilfordii TaxID=458696 RepID=A0A7J7C227_TRIWF|nr:nudix hydrolase 10-like isoform X1 [Tripterygium wilfordii]
MSVSVNSSSPVDQVYENGIQHVNLLPATNDEHGGVILDMKEPMAAEVFQVMLRDSIQQWKQQEGFSYHHAEPNYLMLVCWIPETVSTIPANASHRVAVRAIVINEKREEKIGKLQGVWKIPTGAVDEGEDIFNAAVREVKEETGSFDIQKQELEIEAAQWMPFEEYAAQPFTQAHELYKYIADLCIEKMDRAYAGFTPRPITSDGQVIYI